MRTIEEQAEHMLRIMTVDMSIDFWQTQQCAIKACEEIIETIRVFGDNEIKSSKALPKPDAQGNTHEITGDLTIKGVTKPNTFPAKVEIKGNNVVAMGTVKVDRTAYGVKYNSGKFFPNIGDKMINDEFTIDLKIAAVAPAAKK